MRPKGKLFALLAVFAAIGIVTATGAFTTVSAERTVNVAVVGDGSALLAMEPNATSPNGVYATTTNSEIEVDISSTNSNQGTAFDGTGVNDNATTTVDHVFNITNQGTQEVNISVAYAGTKPSGFHLYQGANSGTDLNSTTYTLPVGETVSIGVYTNTSTGGFEGGEVDVLIEAEAT